MTRASHQPAPNRSADPTPWDRTAEILWSLGWLVPAVLLVAAAGYMFYRRLAGPGSAPEASFTLRDLRKLREQGQLIESEYQRLRETVIGAARSQIQPDNPDSVRGAPED